MTMIGRGVISLRKLNVVEGSEHALNVGERKIRFAHQASAGDPEIDLTNLNFPLSEITTMGGNPSARTLQECNLRFFSPNLSLFSTARGLLIPDIAYTCTNSKILFKGFTAYANEIFYGVIDHATSPNTLFVNAKPINVSRTIGAAQTLFNVGEAYQVNAFPNDRSGAIKVYANGTLLLRNTNNSSSTLDGAYYEIPSGDGYGTTIQFNVPFGAVTVVTVVSSYAYIDTPNFSLMQKMDVLAAQLESIAQQGSFTLDLTAFPNTMDLKAFGDRLIDVEPEIKTHGAIGDVVVSRLNLADFQSERDNTWVACDAGLITGSDLEALTGETNAPNVPPDAQGNYYIKINRI